MMTTFEKLRQLALRDVRLTIDPFEHEYALDTIDAVASDLEDLASQLDAIRTYQEMKK